MYRIWFALRLFENIYYLLKKIPIMPLSYKWGLFHSSAFQTKVACLAAALSIGTPYYPRSTADIRASALHIALKIPI